MKRKEIPSASEVREYTEKTITKGIRKTRELKFYLVKFSIRIIIVLIFLALYITNREGLVDMMMQPIWHGINFVHVIWVIFMIIMTVSYTHLTLPTMAVV